MYFMYLSKFKILGTQCCGYCLVVECFPSMTMGFNVWHNYLGQRNGTGRRKALFVYIQIPYEQCDPYVRQICTNKNNVFKNNKTNNYLFLPILIY